MATKIVTKNSSTASAVPTASDLVQGELAVNVADKRLFTEDNGGSIVELGTNPSSLTVSGNIDVDGTTNLDVVDIDGAVDMASTLTVAGEITANGGIALGDNDKATFGASDDLEIYHDGSASYIKDLGTGPLAINTNGSEIMLTGQSGGEYMLRAIQDGAVELYHDAAKKLATTATGIDVTGTATMDGLTVNTGSYGAVGAGSGRMYGSSSHGLVIQGSGTTNDFLFLGSDGSDSFKIANNGDISFFEDTGTTPKLFWDASAESLGIGTSSPAAKLHIESAGTNEAIRINTDTGYNAGINYYVNDTIKWTAQVLGDGTDAYRFYNFASGEAMRIDSSGNVGIGTSSPSAPLNISATYSSDTTEQFRIQDNTGGKLDFFGYANGGKGLQAYADDGSTFYNLNLQPLGGNVGIGTSSPSAKVDIRDIGGRTIQLGKNPTTNYYGSSLYMSVDIGSTEKAFNIGTKYSATGGNLVFEHSTNDMGRNGDASALTYTERMRIDSSGNLLVGTSGTLYGTAGRGVLEVNGSSSSIAALKVNNAAAGYMYHSGTNMDVWNNLSGYLRFATSGAERMRIDSAGSLLVGTASALLNNRSLQVKANGGNDAAVIQSTAVSAKTLLCWNNVTSGDNQFIGFLTEAGGTQRGLIDYNRASGQVRYNVTSDARLKNNIKNAEESGSLIDSIQVRQYDLKETNHHVGFGFIAQELQAVAPEAVSGDADSEDMMGVDYSKLVPMLIKEIQSLRNRVAQLEE